MIQSTKKDQFWSFWCQGDEIIKIKKFFWWKRALEVLEAIEVAEAAEVNEAVKVSKAVKITTEVFKVLDNSMKKLTLFWCFKQKKCW